MMNSGNASYASILDVAGDGTTSVIQTNMQSAFVVTPALTDTELASILKMKEEEKLAGDVYTLLYQKWGSQIFSRISAAEDNHLNAILTLLKNYGSSDTLVGEVGTFESSEAQSLYNDMVTKASTSLEEAYKTGALIEEMDINDLTMLLSNTTNENVTLVFENLLKGSRNHLRAFYRQLTNLGVTYTPVYINQAEYDQIVNAAMENGNQYKMQGKGNGSGNCTGTGKGNGRP
jgi:hypothetical protein